MSIWTIALIFVFLLMLILFFLLVNTKPDKQCTSNDQCRNGYTCVQRVCTAPVIYCQSDVDCITNAVGTGDPPNICVKDVCVSSAETPCLTINDCPLGFDCDTKNQLCIRTSQTNDVLTMLQGHCQTDADCIYGGYCGENFVCVNDAPFLDQFGRFLVGRNYYS